MKDKLAHNIIDLGRAGESNIRRVILEIPCCWAGATSENTMFLLELPGTTAAIPYDVEINGNTAFVEVDKSMTKAGRGRAQLLQITDETSIEWMIHHWGEDINLDDVIVNSKVYETFCDNSLNTREPVAEPQSTWLTRILEAGNTATFVRELWDQGLIQHKVIAGDNINITRGETEDTISATPTLYDAGQGINISNATISTTQDVDQMQVALQGKQEKLVADDNIRITGVSDEIISAAGLADGQHTTAHYDEGTNEWSINTTQDIDTMKTNLDNLSDDVDDIHDLIMADTSVSNKLANAGFVNSSIASNTGHYIYKLDEDENKVPFDSLAELEAQTLLEVHQNDYAFVQGTDTSGNHYYDRYKANLVSELKKIIKDKKLLAKLEAMDENAVVWAKEYRLNNSSFTAQQWAAISSGIDTSKVTQIQTNKNDIASANTRIDGKQDTLTAGNHISIANNVIGTDYGVGTLIFHLEDGTTATLNMATIQEQ